MTELPNWFLQAGGPAIFERHLSSKKGEEIHCLQVGAYKGDASAWLMENILSHPKSTLTDVDTWLGSDEVEMDVLNWNEVEQAYDAQTSSYVASGRIIKKKMTSDEFFATKDSEIFYDFIYIDGSHEAVPVLKDGMNAVEALKVGGILAFDDYMWDQGKGPAYNPKHAIIAIANCYSNRLNVLEQGYQVWLNKTS